MNIEDITVLNYKIDHSLNRLVSNNTLAEDFDDKSEIEPNDFFEAPMDPQSTK